MGAIPSKNIPETVSRLLGRYVSERLKGESFQDFVKRIGKPAVKKMLEDLTRVPSHDADASYYSDWGDRREFTIGDMGVGECAGEVVSRADFDLAAAERQAFEGQVLLEKGEFQEAGETAYGSMIQASRALVAIQLPQVPLDNDQVLAEFKVRFYETQLFFDPFALPPRALSRSSTPTAWSFSTAATAAFKIPT